MKRRLFAVLGVLLLTTVPVTASQGGPKPKPPKPPKPSVSASAPKPQVSKVKPVSVKTSHHAKPPKPVKATTVKPAKSTAVKPAKSTAKATRPAKATKAPKAETKSTKKSTTSAHEPVTLTRVQQKLQQNTKLADKLRNRLPAGTNLMEAAQGFKNLGQFVAAVNVSNNLGIPFDSLKASMVDDGYSLGQSIQRAKAEANGTVEARRAESDAQRMIAESEVR